MAGNALSFVCKRCNEPATVEEITDFMSVVGCIRCDVSEVLGLSIALTPMDHFKLYEAPHPRPGEWRN